MEPLEIWTLFIASWVVFFFYLLTLTRQVQQNQAAIERLVNGIRHIMDQYNH